MFSCSATFALACQIAVWLSNANATLLPSNWRFEQHHIKAIVDTAYEESGFRPCIKSRDGSVGLWQWRGSRREYLHVKANTPPTTCVADRVPGPVHDRRASDAPGSAGFLRGSRLLDREIDLRARVRGAPGGFDPPRRFVIASERPQPNSHFRDCVRRRVISAPLYLRPWMPGAALAAVARSAPPEP